MARIIVVTSGKGGVGKTTSSAAIATGLAQKGKKTVVIDFDIGLRNLDLIMGCERRVVYDFVNVIQGDATLNQALIKDKRTENLYILPASQTRDKDALTREGVAKVLDDLKAMDFEFIVCDSPAGIETGALMALYFADEAIITTNPEVSSVRDSDRILGILASKSRRAENGEEPIKEHLLLTRYNPGRVSRGDMLSMEDVLEILDQIERGFDDIEHRIANMDKEHTKYVRATVTRLNYLLSGETDTKGLVVQLLNRISAEENGVKKEEKLRKTAERMNLSYLEILSEKSLYKRRKSRTDFISKMETEEETEDLNREEVLKMNRIQMRYSRAEIEEFIQAHMTGDIMDAGAMKDMTDEDFEKLILAYDYSTRRNSKYAALNEEDRMVENGRYRYPDLKFIQRRP